MKSFEGYLKQTAGDTYLLLAGGGIKPLSDLITTSNISSQSIPWTNITTGTNNKTLYLDFPSFVFRDKNGGWILGKTDNNTGAVSLGSAAIAQDVELNSSGGNITLKGSGLVGIGTRSPAAKLHTSGNTRVDFSSGYGTYYYGPAGESSIEFYCNSTSKAVFGATSSFAFMYNRNRSNYLKYQDDGILSFEGYEVWHKRNSPWNLVPFTINAAGLDQNTYYPVLISMPRDGLMRIEVYNFLTGASIPSWSTHGSGGFSLMIAWETNINGWGTIGVTRNIHAATYGWSNVYPAGSIGLLTNASLEYIYVRGGGVYYFKVTNGCTPTLYTTTYSYGGQSIAPTTSVTFPSREFGSSDQSLKTKINHISNTLPIVEYNWKDTGLKSYGFIAQELRSLGRNELIQGLDGVMTVNYNGALAYYLAKLSNIVEENNININNRINLLEKRILDLELENQDLKERLNN